MSVIVPGFYHGQTLHHLLNAVLGGPDGDMWWAAVRALLAVCSLITAWTVRFSTDRYLAWIALTLAGGLFLKVSDDIHTSLTHQSAPALTVYFAVSNLLWCLLLIGMARMAVRKHRMTLMLAGAA